MAVEFGKTKIYTALVFKIHSNPPVSYDAKDIHQILDELPLVNSFQLKLWEWISTYYMCSLGEVFRGAVPSSFLLESETIIRRNKDFSNDNELNNDEFLVMEALEYQEQLSIQQVISILNKKTVLPVIKELIDKKGILVHEHIYDQYKPKFVKYVKLNTQWEKTENLNALLTNLSRAKKQRQAILSYFNLKTLKKPIKLDQLVTESRTSKAIINALVDKEILDIYFIKTDRINFKGKTIPLKQLTTEQSQGLNSIKKAFNTKDSVLLKGITSSGKTEVYVHLINEYLKKGKQVLYLLPEIALTTQLIYRLQNYFGDCLSVYHSKYSVNERVEVWNNVLANKKKARLIIGARSAVFLPFSNLGLIIIDEEHEPSFKQFDPAPRYHARDTAIMLAKIQQAKTILGSATPSVETYYNAKQEKFGFVELKKRFGNVMLPEIELVNLKEKYRKKRMNGHFSDRLIEMIVEALENKEQIILFQNRRGYAPVVECETCGVSPQCPQCDVSLTFHSFKKELRCHYCGYKQAMLVSCSACGSNNLNAKGFGTEQIEMEVAQLFPSAKIGRMDLDSTRGKYGYQKIIGKFQAQEIDILVGTQMLSKGLDFSNVALVGILNADNMLNFPDFRAYERSYQLMVQVSGRAGRNKKRGRVAIQSFNPYHQILQQVSTNAYEDMFKEQLDDRWQFHYPPFYRLIKITLRDKNFNKVDDGALWLEKSFKNIFKSNVLGPSTPGISKIRNYYIRTFLIKIPQKQSLSKTKSAVLKVKNTFQAVKDFRSIRFTIDVDCY